ncbi:MAG TPA: holo-ACP synthase [Thermomicrobiales bacterium]|nr:holo-ACP synthase [Thermomicrobiales bacterium]HRA47302.1 holo-ACP synthase [Thermomicrobiales bacterium]
MYIPEFDPEKSGRIVVGIDLIEISRIERTLTDFGDRFLNRVYTARERDRYRNRPNELAARFAAKEAISKALGTGIRGIRWRDMEIVANRRGKPIIVLHGSSLARAELLGITDFDISLTHSRTDAMAFVVGFRSDVQSIPEDS